MFGDLLQPPFAFENLSANPAHTEALRNLVSMGIGSIHGSSSGSLIDVLKDGLVATGNQQQVSFTGEMMGGILPSSLNHRNVSVVGLEQLEVALSYADRNLRGWSPAQSTELMSLSEGWMREGGATDEIVIAWREIRSRIETARIARWQALQDDERSLISHPFPVVYGISSEVPTYETSTKVAGERSISAAEADKLTVFVPEHKVQAIRTLVERFASPCRVESLALISPTISNQE